MHSIKYAILLLLALSISCTGSLDRPNFLFILVDDLGYMDVGFNNPDTFYETPSIDRLASGGMVFTRAYAACPVCSPTRASILTGRYPARLGTTDYFGAPQPKDWQRNTPLLPAGYKDYLPHEEITIAEVLKEAGYRTFFAGKWHLGGEGFWPEDQGFDINRGGITRGGPYGGNRYFSPYGNPRLEDGPEGEHLPDRLATETIRFIDMENDSPFFAYLSFYSVHTPLMARQDLLEKYIEKSAAWKPDEWGDESPRKVRLVQNHPIYASMVEAMDQAVGRVLDHLDSTGLASNTVVIFMSDNGGLSTSEGHPTSNMPLRAGKGWLYEGGIREPMIIRWPSRGQAGISSQTPVISTDFFPTIIEMAGVKPPEEVEFDGVSLVDILTGRGIIEDRQLYWHYPHYGNQGGTPGGAILDGEYKLVEFFENRPPELYNLAADQGELINLSDSLPVIRDSLLTCLHRWQAKMGALFTEPNPLFSSDK